ncbi:MAG: hypothetical protein Q8N59_03375 [bacterium]|nr:hypothetical protein [bacterium]
MSEKDLEKFFSGIKEKIKPSKELSQRILADLSVTEKEDSRCVLREKEKGRISGYELILNQIHIFMTKWKMAVPVVLVVLVVAGLMIIRSGQKTQPTQEAKPVQEQSQAAETEYVQVPNEVFVPRATGNIDDIINAMTALAENEQVIIVEEGNDASMVTLDSQAISDFGQSYDENQF